MPGCILISSQNFQELEETHVCQMKDFIDTYAKAWENEHALRGQVGVDERNPVVFGLLQLQHQHVPIAEHLYMYIYFCVCVCDPFVC